MKTEAHIDAVPISDAVPAFLLDGGLMRSPIPTRGLCYSVAVHGIFALVFYAPWSYPISAHLASSQSITQLHQVLLLPALAPGGNSTAAASCSTGNKNNESAASLYDGKSVEGIVYNGPQRIISNAPHPDNFIQTVRQPDLITAPKLPAPLPLAPVVAIAAVSTAAPPALQPVADVPHEDRPIQVAAAEPVSFRQQERRMDAPKLPIPMAGSADTRLRVLANTGAPPSMPSLAHQNSPAKNGSEMRDLLIVDALPVPGPKPVVPPAGELHGTFTVSPSGATAIGLAGGGKNSKGSPGVAETSDEGPGPYAGNGKKSSSSSAQVQPDRSSGSSTPGSGSGNSTSKSAGSGAGIGILTSGSGNGNGRSSGSGNSPFPSIMIQGGSSSVRSVSKSPESAVGTNPQGRYGITIVANGASGGGFKDFGVFRNEASYTVYVDMNDVGIHGASCALQYALESRSASGSSEGSRVHGVLEPPYAISKSLPHFSPAEVGKGEDGTIVVFGVIGPQGTFEKLRIMHSPNPSLDPSLLQSLGVWIFRPAEMDGVKVAVKVLLGIPIKFVQ